MITRIRYVTLLLMFGAVVYFFVLFNFDVRRSSVATRPAGRKAIKKIVSYSLKKQIEIEGEEIFCEHINYANESLGPVRRMWTAIANTKVLVYSVYVDDRLRPYKYLRIIGMYRGSWNATVYCQIFGRNDTYHVTKSKKTDIWVQQWNNGDENTYNPVLISCQIPSESTAGRLSLTGGDPCVSGSDFFAVNRDATRGGVNFERKTVAACVKPLNFENDISERLMQWIEINRIIGADKIDVYVGNVHENVARLLRWYQQTQSDVNVIEYANYKNDDVTSASWLNVNNGGDSEKILTDVTVNESEETVREVWQKRRDELIPYNDCFYRNLNVADFILPIDIDEVIIPKRVDTWRQFLNDLLNRNPRIKAYASLSVRNAYFFRGHRNESNEQSAFFLNHRTRSDFSAREESGKSFVSTKNALTLFNHYVLHVLRPGLGKVFFLSPDVVQMNHYRENCPIRLLPECKKYLGESRNFNDTLIFKYRQEFDTKYRSVTEQFKKFKDNAR